MTPDGRRSALRRADAEWGLRGRANDETAIADAAAAAEAVARDFAVGFPLRFDADLLSVAAAAAASADAASAEPLPSELISLF